MIVTLVSCLLLTASATPATAAPTVTYLQAGYDPAAAVARPQVATRYYPNNYPMVLGGVQYGNGI